MCVNVLGSRSAPCCAWLLFVLNRKVEQGDSRLGGKASDRRSIKTAGRRQVLILFRIEYTVFVLYNNNFCSYRLSLYDNEI